MKQIPLPGPVPHGIGLNHALNVARAALTGLGVEASECDMLGFSGAAFRVYWRAARDPRAVGIWDPASCRVCAYDALTAATEAFGWKVLRYDDCAPQAAWQFTIQSLSRSTPVIANGPLGEPEAALIVGAEHSEDGPVLLIHHRHSPHPEPILMERLWPEGGDRVQIRLLERIEDRRRRSEDEMIHRAMRRIVWIAGQEAYAGANRFLAGERAHAALLMNVSGSCGQDECSATGEEIARAYGIRPGHGAVDHAALAVRHVLHLTLGSLAEGRRAGLAFLRRRCAQMAPAQAVAAFEQEVRCLEEAGGFWPPCIEFDGDRFAVTPEPLGFDLPLRLEETARILRSAGSLYATAVAAVESGVPPTEQELLDPGEF